MAGPSAGRSVVCAVAAVLACVAVVQGPPQRTQLIVQGKDLSSAAAAVRRVGGTITHELPIIDAVGARLTRGQANRLAASPAVRRLYADRNVTVAGPTVLQTYYPTLVEAD